MNEYAALFGSDLWKPALDKYAEATGLSVELFGADGTAVLGSMHATPLLALLRTCGAEPGLFAECAGRCLAQTVDRPAVVVADCHGLTVVGSSLALDGAIVGAAVAGYAVGRFAQVTAVQRWAESLGVPFDRLWNVARRQSPLPERRLQLHGELLQVLGDALLRENHRTRLYEDAVVKLEAASTAKDEFLAVLSHELRTPLSAIVGWVNVLKRTTSMEHVSRATASIERSAMRQSRMVEDLLDVTRMANGTIRLDLAIHDLPALLRGVVEASAQEIETKAIRLELAPAGEPLFIEGDVGRLQQVFGNIVSNAVKFTPAGGSVGIAIERDADHVLVRVTDSGRGIEPEFLPFVFAMFRQQEQGTRREHDGLGIGLALVKRLTELHHGKVSICSAGLGCGTEVTVSLPLAIDATQPSAAAAPVGGEPQASALAGLSVLVVEDAEDARESLRQLLLLLGVKVSVAVDGREALDMIGAADPDLVLCDLRMPRMDGYEFIRELHRDPAHPPVVAISGLASDADRERTRNAGFEAHIKKPFDEATIVAAAVAAVTRQQAQPPRDRPAGAAGGGAWSGERRGTGRTAGKSTRS